MSLSPAQQRIVTALRTKGTYGTDGDGVLRGVRRSARRTLTAMAAKGIVEIEARTIMVPEVVYDVRRGPNFPKEEAGE